jgi:hypothetical protein
MARSRLQAARTGNSTIARRGDECYEREVKPHVRPEDEGKFAAIDLDSGAYEVDTDELAAMDRLRARHHDTRVWLTRVGQSYAHRIGCALRSRAA